MRTYLKYLKNDLTTFILRIGLLYAILFVCRIFFYIVNYSKIGAISIGELPEIIHGSLVFDSVSIFYVNGLFVIFSLLPLRIRSEKWYQNSLFWIYTIVNTAVIFVNFADIIFYNFTDKRFTSEEFYTLGNGNNTSIVFQSILQNWYLVLAFVATVWCMIWCYRRIKYHATEIKKLWQYILVNTIILLAVLTAVFGLIRGGYTHAIRPIALNNANQYVNSSPKAALILSNPFCLIRTIGYIPFEPKVYFDDETLESLYSPLHFPEMSTHCLGKRNIVIFTLESFGHENSALLNPDYFESNDPGYMPFLDSLMRNSYTFTNAYSSGHKSIDALPSILASIPTYKTPFVLMPQANAEIDGLPKILVDCGYNTSFFCGSIRESMGFKAFTNQISIQNYYSKEDYEAVNGKNDFDGIWGIWDEPFLQYVAKTLDTKTEPFMAQVFTLTSHHPFKVPTQWEDKLPEGRSVIQKPTAYTDQALKNFMEYASNQPWYKNTIFVFTSDHFPYVTSDDNYRHQPKGSSIVMFIYTPEGSLKGFDSSVTSQIDLMPTLLGLIGNEKPYFAFGKDIFNEPDRPRCTITYQNNMYMLVTDSLVLNLDDQTGTTKGLYLRSDAGQQNNIFDPENVQHKELESHVKAIIQSYGKQVANMNYLNR